MKTKRAQVGLVTLIAAASLVGCAGKTEAPKAHEPQTTKLEISYAELQTEKQISRSVNMAVGDTLELTLGSNASTGFEWADNLLISDPKVMTQIKHEAIAGEADRPGAPGKEVWTLEAKAPGNTTVSSTYGRPWPGGEKDSWVFSANVAVS